MDAPEQDAGPPPEPLCAAAPIVNEAYGGKDSEQGYGITPAGDGALLVGHRNVPGAYSEGIARRVDSEGAFVWETIVTGPEYDVFESAATDPVQGFALAGYRGTLGQGTGEAWLVGMSPTGQVTWQVETGGGGDDLLRSVIRTSGGFWLAVGIDADVITGTTDALVLAVDDAGETLWTKKHGGLDSEAAFAVCETGDGRCWPPLICFCLPIR